jgi:hypothetical protein
MSRPTTARVAQAAAAVLADIHTNWSGRTSPAAPTPRADAPPGTSQNVTKPHTLKKRELSPRQRAAVLLIMAGKHDAAVGEGVGVARETVCRWRNQDPLFIAELNRLRREIWAVASQRFDHLIINALGVLDRHMQDRYDMARFRAAAVIMKAGAKHLAPPAQPLDPERVAAELVELGVELDEAEDPAAQAKPPPPPPPPAPAPPSPAPETKPKAGAAPARQSCPIVPPAAATPQGEQAEGPRAASGGGDFPTPDRPPPGTLTPTSKASGNAP